MCVFLLVLCVYRWAVCTNGDECVLLAGDQVYIVGLGLLSLSISVLCDVLGFLSLEIVVF